MPYPATVYQVMIASPSDVSEERLLVRQVIDEWNAINSTHTHIVLMPVGWETHAAPGVERPQELINQYVLKDADLLVALFWNRIGSHTGKAVSGTVEELENHIQAGKHAMIYFSSAKISPREIDQKQLKALEKFRKEYERKALFGTYSDLNELRKEFTRQLAQTVLRYFKSSQSINTFVLPRPSSPFIPLSDEAKVLLIQASKDSNGEVISIRTRDGFSVYTNGVELVKRGNARDEARWEGAISELVVDGLIKDRSGRGEIFHITSKGYDTVGRIDFEAFQASSTPLSITSPANMTGVERHTLVEGFAKDKTAAIWPVLRSVSGKALWVQWPAEINAQGQWRAQIIVGQEGNIDVGAHYQLRVLLNPKERIESGDELTEWPDAEYASDIVEIIRK